MSKFRVSHTFTEKLVLIKLTIFKSTKLHACPVMCMISNTNFHFLRFNFDFLFHNVLRSQNFAFVTHFLFNI